VRTEIGNLFGSVKAAPKEDTKRTPRDQAAKPAPSVYDGPEDRKRGEFDSLLADDDWSSLK